MNNQYHIAILAVERSCMHTRNDNSCILESSKIFVSLKVKIVFKNCVYFILAAYSFGCTFSNDIDYSRLMARVYKFDIYCTEQSFVKYAIIYERSRTLYYFRAVLLTENRIFVSAEKLIIYILNEHGAARHGDIRGLCNAIRNVMQIRIYNGIRYMLQIPSSIECICELRHFIMPV